MKKTLIIMSIFLLAATSIVLAATQKSWIEMQNVIGSDAAGSAHIKEMESMENGLQKIKISINIKNLPVSEGKVFEGWLVDTDTGYKLSIGGFSTGADGKAVFYLKQQLVNFGLYDLIVVTEEPEGDTNPNPDTPILMGNLH